MTEPTTSHDAAADAGRPGQAAETALRAHVDRATLHLRELESDLDGMQHDGTIQEDRDGTKRLIESVRGDLLRTQHALDRIEAGTYGTCTTCREPIAAPRLEAIPEVERCSSCA